MGTRNSNPIEKHKEPRTAKRATIGMAVIVGLLALGYMAHTMIQLRAATLRIVRAVSTSRVAYRQGNDTELLKELRSIEPDVVRVNAALKWAGVLENSPSLGPKIRAARTLMPVLLDITQAASAMRVSGGGSLGGGVPRLSPQVITNLARLAQTVCALKASDTTAIMAPTIVHRMQRRLQPWLGLAQLATQDPKMVRSLFGIPGGRYLVLFQDSGELRATGGFMAAYGYLEVRQGRISFHFQPNISWLDRQVTVHPAAPWALTTYFSQARVPFINANFNPDVPSSARLIEKEYASVPKAPKIDGVIFVDTWLADRLLGLLGSVKVDHVIFNAQNLNVKMEYMAERRHLSGSTRMLFLGEIAKTLIARVAKPSVPLSRLWTVAAQELRDHHLILYANNSRLERWLVSRGWAGSIPRLSSLNSLLVVNDNYGGLKDNYFLDTRIRVNLHSIAGGRYEETVTTQWTMHGVYNGWMVGTYVGWIQCYVPLGTKLVRLVGYHVHGIRTKSAPGIDRTIYGTGILMAPRRSRVDPPIVRTLQWRFLLPKLRHPHYIRILVQPGLRGVAVSYVSSHGAVTAFLPHDQLIRVR